MFTFPKSNRLLNRRAFQPAMDSGDKVVCRELVVLVKKTVTNDGPGNSENSSPTSRLGLVVSKKVGNAVVRNRLKRVLRESFRQKNLMPGSDIVVIARGNAAACSNEDLRLAFERSVLRHAGRKNCPR